MIQFGIAQPPVLTGHQRSDPRGREVEFDVLNAVFRQHGNPVTDTDAPRPQTFAQGHHALARLCIAEAARGVRQRRPPWPASHRFLEEIEDAELRGRVDGGLNVPSRGVTHGTKTPGLARKKKITKTFACCKQACAS